MNIDFGKAFTFAVERVKNNPVFYIIGGLIIFGVNFFVSLIGNIFSFVFNFVFALFIRLLNLQGDAARILAGGITAVWNILIGMILGFVVAPLIVGYFKGIKKEYEGKDAEVADIFSALNMFLPSMLNYAIATIITIIGLLLCIIPYFLLLPIIPLTLYFLAQSEDGGIEPVKKAFETLKSNPMLILWTYVTMIIASLGILLCCVGIFITGPVAVVIMYVIISQALGKTSGGSANFAKSDTVEPLSSN